MEELKEKYKVEYKIGYGKDKKTLYPLKKLEQLGVSQLKNIIQNHFLLVLVKPIG